MKRWKMKGKSVVKCYGEIIKCAMCNYCRSSEKLKSLTTLLLLFPSSPYSGIGNCIDAVRVIKSRTLHMYPQIQNSVVLIILFIMLNQSKRTIFTYYFRRWSSSEKNGISCVQIFYKNGAETSIELFVMYVCGFFVFSQFIENRIAFSSS